jgi:hypothetical protein
MRQPRIYSASRDRRIEEWIKMSGKRCRGRSRAEPPRPSFSKSGVPARRDRQSGRAQTQSGRDRARGSRWPLPSWLHARARIVPRAFGASVARTEWWSWYGRCRRPRCDAHSTSPQRNRFMLADRIDDLQCNVQCRVEIEQTRPVANLIDVQHGSSREKTRALTRPGFKFSGET